MADWATISALATAGGTLILAIATFASVRSANKAARTAERALQVGMRPLLAGSRLTDPDIKIGWVDEHHAVVGGGRASLEVDGDRLYLAMSLRNVGSGVAVLQEWNVVAGVRIEDAEFGAVDGFRRQTRDLFITANDIGFWQAAIREADDPLYAPVRAAVEERRRLLIDLVYSNDEGDQRALTRFVVDPHGGASGQWTCAVGRHTYLDRPDPR